MVEGKKKRKKLKKLVKKETGKTVVKQKATQITKINIKIGDDKKKGKKKRKKKTTGGEPGRLRRRPHLPPNPMIGAINYTPPPGYMTPGDVRALYQQQPPAAPAQAPGFAPAVPALPQAQGQVIGQVAQGQVVEGQPVAVAARPNVVQPQGRPRVDLVDRIVGFGPARPSVSFAPSIASQSLGGNSPVPSFGTSGGAASPRSVLRNRDFPGSNLNPAPSENAIAFAQQQAQAARLASAGLSLGGGLMSVAPFARQTSNEPQAGSEVGSEDESKALGSVNPDSYRVGQAMNGIRTGGSAMGSGGGGGLMGGGSTAMGNQGSYIEPVYYMSGKRKGEIRTEKRGGARAGGGRPKGAKNKAQVQAQVEAVDDDAASSSSSRLSRIGKALGFRKSGKSGKGYLSLEGGKAGKRPYTRKDKDFSKGRI
tara:strand:- start:967 stop:2235 length:1269 start_codon:yes stop_codon:yes gene_type:complete